MQNITLPIGTFLVESPWRLWELWPKVKYKLQR